MDRRVLDAHGHRRADDSLALIIKPIDLHAPGGRALNPRSVAAADAIVK
jgi:hypothetical protein